MATTSKEQNGKWGNNSRVCRGSRAHKEARDIKKPDHSGLVAGCYGKLLEGFNDGRPMIYILKN